jgi:uncharacterized membrane protein
MHLSDLHTIVDRFTIAFVNAGIIFELTALLFKREGLKQFSWNCLRLGLAFAVISVASGFISEATVYISPEATALSNYHKLLGVLVTGMLAIAVALRTMFKERYENAVLGAGLRGAYLAVMVLTFFLSGMTGVMGTRMVYAFGVNVRPYERILISMPPPVNHPLDTVRNTITTPDSLPH